jgi:hypothetical protein
MDMKKRANIHNLDTLEREIYRLKLKAKNQEEQFDRNIRDLRGNFWDMCFKSVNKDRESDGKQAPFASLFHNEGLNNAFNRVATHIADLAVEGINAFLDKLFEKKS